jgi:Ca2+-binding EF-hand superfamily protein
MGLFQSKRPAVPQDNVIEQQLHALYDALDTNHDQRLSNEELAGLFIVNGNHVLTPESVAALMARYNDKKSPPRDAWTFEEFRRVFGKALVMFNDIDTDKNGVIDSDELEMALMLNSDHPFDYGGASPSSLISRFDISHDGKLNFVEFFFLWDLGSREKLADLLDYWSQSMVCFSDSPLVVLPHNVLGSLACGGLSGAVGRTVTAPLSRLLTMAQISEKESMSQLARGVMQREGVKGFWRGNALTLGKIVPSVAINLVLFEQMQAALKAQIGVTGNSAAIDIVSGAVAGTVGTVVTFPLDTLKAKMQASTNQQSLAAIVRQMPLRNLFQGLGLAVAEIAPQTSLRFYLMLRARDAFAEKLNDSAKSSYSAIIVSSIVGGVVSQAVTYPLGLLRRVQQTTDLPARMCVKKVYAASGLRGFFRGLPLNIAQIVPSVAIGFATYEWSKQYVLK